MLRSPISVFMLNRCGGTIVGTAYGPTDETIARTTIGACGGTIVGPMVGTTIGDVVGTVVGPLGGTITGPIVRITAGTTVGTIHFHVICCVSSHFLEWTILACIRGPFVLLMDY